MGKRIWKIVKARWLINQDIEPNNILFPSSTIYNENNGRKKIEDEMLLVLYLIFNNIEVLVHVSWSSDIDPEVWEMH